MPSLGLQLARELLLRVINKHFAERHSPLPGAFVKAQMLAEASQSGAVFNERDLGYRRFVEFVKDVPGVAIHGPRGSDVLLAPAGSSGILADHVSEPPRLRRDFWRAFIEFPIDNTVRLYDLAEDRIVYEAADVERRGIPIEPVSRETQLAWRKEFAGSQPDTVQTELSAALEKPGKAVFNEFARRLRENPALMKAWNRFMLKRVVDHVRAWATEHGVQEDRWLAAPVVPGRQDATTAILPAQQVISSRAVLYDLFDQVPLDDLLELRVPLGWLLKARRRGHS